MDRTTSRARRVGSGIVVQQPLHHPREAIYRGSIQNGESITISKIDVSPAIEKILQNALQNLRHNHIESEEIERPTGDPDRIKQKSSRYRVGMVREKLYQPPDISAEDALFELMI